MQNVIETIEFFRVESNQNDAVEQYDFNKIILFCLLFFQEREDIKASCLFYLMCDQNELITNRNGQVKTIIAMLTIISCMIPAEIIKTVSRSELSSRNYSISIPVTWVTFTSLITYFNSVQKDCYAFSILTWKIS